MEFTFKALDIILNVVEIKISVYISFKRDFFFLSFPLFWAVDNDLEVTQQQIGTWSRTRCTVSGSPIQCIFTTYKELS